MYIGFLDTPRRFGAWFPVAAVLIASAAMFQPKTAEADIVPVRHKEGLEHGFLALRSLEGKLLADGQMMQNTKGNEVTSRLSFRFKDGSIYEETTKFSQAGKFRLLSDHLVQKGPSFKQAMDTVIDASTGQVNVRYSGDDGKEKVITERLELPEDVSNGLLLTLLKDVQPTVPRTTVSMVATTPKPRLVKLAIAPQGQQPFRIGSSRHAAIHYVVKVEIGGVAGAVAPLVGKQPADTHVWVLGGTAPAFVKAEGPLYQGGPIWRIQMANPPVF